MNYLTDFHFIRPIWLLLLPLIFLIWRAWQNSQDPLRGWRDAIDQPLLTALTVGKNANSKLYENVLLAAWLIAVVSVAGPTWKPEPSPFADDPVPVMIVLKASETMNSEDMLPSRMERARLKTADFANERQGQPMGLLAYAGSAHLVLPPTRDTNIIASMAAEVSPAIMPKTGDNLVDALELAEATLTSSGGSIVVIADDIGEENQSALIEFRKEYSLPINILAIAHPETAELKSIQRAAKTLKAQVVLFTPDLTDIQQLVNSTAKPPVSVSFAGEGVRWAELGWWLVPVLALLSLASFRSISNEAAVLEPTT